MNEINNMSKKAGMVDFGFLRRAEDGSFEVCGVPLKRKPLLRLMRLGQRGGGLLKILSAGEYMFVKLVVKLKDEVRSFILARALAPIVKKLLEASQAVRELMIKVVGEVDYWMREVGRALAERLARIAKLWGHRSAYKWLKDESFIRYLTIMNLPRLQKQKALES
jgi:energy-converting hydrogenase Eha subunit C